MTLLCKLDRLAAEEQVSSLDDARLKRELKIYRTTGTGSYVPLLPEQLAMLQSVQGRCSA